MNDLQDLHEDDYNAVVESTHQFLSRRLWFWKVTDWSRRRCIEAALTCNACFHAFADKHINNYKGVDNHE